VREAEGTSKSIVDLPLDILKKYSTAFGPDYFKDVTLEAALARKTVPGGTSVSSVRFALEQLHARVGALEAVR
jgi:argininosuccinate lyase